MKKKYIYYLLLVVVLFLIMKVTTVENNPVEEAEAAYHSFLKQYADKYPYFQILPIGTEKEPVLLVTDYVDEGYTSCAYIYYYDGNKVKPLKEKYIATQGTAYYLSYKEGYLYIPHRWGGGTRVQINGADAVGDSCVYNAAVDVSVTNTYKNGEYYDRKEVSGDEYLRFEEKWQGEPINFVKNEK